MGLHRFSPIRDAAQFESALTYVSKQMAELTKLLTGLHLPVPIVKVFAHYPDEFDTVKVIVNSHGTEASNSSYMSYYVDVEDGLTINNGPVELLGVRRPDPYRRHVGCADSYVDNFAEFRPRLLNQQPEFCRIVESEHELSMIELWHPDYDVLGYLIPAEE